MKKTLWTSWYSDHFKMIYEAVGVPQQCRPLYIKAWYLRAYTVLYHRPFLHEMYGIYFVTYNTVADHVLIQSAHHSPGGGGLGTAGKYLVGRLSTSLKNGPNRIWQGSKKGGQLDWELGKRGSIGLNINTIRGQSDQAWLFEGFEDVEKGTQSDWKAQKRGSSPRNLPTMPKYGSYPPPRP